jgi:hypothetical protein
VDYIADGLFGLNDAGPPGLRRNANTALGEVAFAATEGALAQVCARRRIVGHRAVVGHRDDECVTGETPRFQEVHESAGHGVERFLVSLADETALQRDFMENLLPQVGVIKAFGTMAGPVKGDLPIPMIAARDIGDAATDTLLRLDFQGKSTHELQGARDVMNTEAAKIVGAAIGKPDLTYKIWCKQDLSAQNRTRLL